MITLWSVSLIASVGNIMAQRTERLLNEGWEFRFSHQVQKSPARRVDLPHTWNAQDALSGKTAYTRGIGNYTKPLFVGRQSKGRRLFLRFEGANSICNVFINGKYLGEHRGGYGAFIFEITDAVKYAADNELSVRVNNAEQLDVMPLVGDFNFYGGPYRDVHLLSTGQLCISPLDYASPGIYLVQQKVTEEKADVRTRVLLSNSDGRDHSAQLRLEVLDGERALIRKEKDVLVKAGTLQAREEMDFSILSPKLWNGTQDPFMYRAVVSLWSNGKEIDRVEQPLGLRYYHTDANKGFFLNGKHLPLHGVAATRNVVRWAMR